MNSKLVEKYEQLRETIARDLPKPVFYYKGWRYYYPVFTVGRHDINTGRPNEYNVLTPTSEPKHIPWDDWPGMTFGDFKLWVLLGSPPLSWDQCTSKYLHKAFAEKIKADNIKGLTNKENPGVSGEF